MRDNVIQFIPRTEHLVRDLSEPVNVIILPVVRTDHFSDDVYYMSPPIQLPCDSEAE